MNKFSDKDYYFKIDWVLQSELAIGRAPTQINDFKTLCDNKINSILNLCSNYDCPFPDNEYKDKFEFVRYELPDHKYERKLRIEEIHDSIKILEELLKKGAVYIHCFAGMERSPLICISYLMKKHNLSLLNSMDYLKQIHPETNPLQNQLDLLKKIKFK